MAAAGAVLAAAGLAVAATSAWSGPSADPAAGQRVFSQSGCGSCHTLAAAGARGTIGTNLDKAKPTFERVVSRVTNGAGIMPSFKNKLAPKDIDDVAAFVVKATGGVPPGGGDGPATGPGPPATGARLQLSEWRLTSDTRRVKAGKVRLVVRNSAPHRLRIRLTHRAGKSAGTILNISVPATSTVRRVLVLAAGRLRVTLVRPGPAGRRPRLTIEVVTAPAAPPPPPPSSPPAGLPEDGKGIFQTLCGTCHTLADAGTTGRVGPNLDREEPDCEDVLEALREGEDEMPSFSDALSREQMDRVAAYVSGATGGDPCGDEDGDHD